MKIRTCLLAVPGAFLVWPLCWAGTLKETEFTPNDLIRLLHPKGDRAAQLERHPWSFIYTPEKPVGRLDILLYEERTDQAGKTTTKVRHACMLGMVPRERVFPIKLLLVGNELHAMIDAAKDSIKLSEDFAMGTAEYRQTGDRKETTRGRRFLIEVGNKKEYKGQAPFKNELKFKIYEDLDQATLKMLLEGGQIPETVEAGQDKVPKA